MQLNNEDAIEALWTMLQLPLVPLAAALALTPPQGSRIRWPPAPPAFVHKICAGGAIGRVQPLLNPHTAVVAKASAAGKTPKRTRPQCHGRSTRMRLLAALAIWAVVVVGRAGAAPHVRRAGQAAPGAAVSKSRTLEAALSHNCISGRCAHQTVDPSQVWSILLFAVVLNSRIY